MSLPCRRGALPEEQLLYAADMRTAPLTDTTRRLYGLQTSHRRQRTGMACMPLQSQQFFRICQTSLIS